MTQSFEDDTKEAVIFAKILGESSSASKALQKKAELNALGFNAAIFKTPNSWLVGWFEDKGEEV